MEVARVQGEQLLPRDGVAQVIFVRADDVALRADAEELALHGVQVVGPIDREGEDLVEGLGQALPRADAVDRQVLHAVGNPDVGDAGLAEGRADRCADLAAGDAVLDPELADAGVLVGQRHAVGRLGMGEVGRVEVHAQSLLLAPIDPALEMLGGQFVAIDPLAARLGVAGVQIEAVLSGDEREGLDRVAAQFVGGAGLAGVVARDGQTAAQFLAGLLEPAHVVALPAVQGNGHGGQALQSGGRIDPQRGIALLGGLVGRFNRCRGGGIREDRCGHGVSSVSESDGVDSPVRAASGRL